MGGLVDRHFKYPREPAKDLRQFRERLVSTTQFMEPSAISGQRAATHVLETVVAAYDAAGGTITIARGGSPIVVGEPVHASSFALDLAHDGNVYGQLVLGPRPGTKSYGERDHEPLSATANTLAEILARQPAPRAPRPPRKLSSA